MEDGAARPQPDAAAAIVGGVVGKNAVGHRGFSAHVCPAAEWGFIAGEGTSHQRGDVIKIRPAAVVVGGRIAGEGNVGERGAGSIKITASPMSVRRVVHKSAARERGGGIKIRPAPFFFGGIARKNIVRERGTGLLKIRPASPAACRIVGEGNTGERGTGHLKESPAAAVCRIAHEGNIGERGIDPRKIRPAASVGGEGRVVGEGTVRHRRIGTGRGKACTRRPLTPADGQSIEHHIRPGDSHHPVAVVGACAHLIIAVQVAGQDGGVGERAVRVAGAVVIGGGVESGFRAGKTAVDPQAFRDGEPCRAVVAGVGGVGATSDPELVAGHEGGGECRP